MPKNSVNLPEGISQADVDKAFGMLASRKKAEDKAKVKRANMTDEEKAEVKVKNLRISAKQTILRKKAVESGITVSEEEIDVYIAANA